MAELQLQNERVERLVRDGSANTVKERSAEKAVHDTRGADSNAPNCPSLIATTAYGGSNEN
jgi:hypothetical protein